MSKPVCLIVCGGKDCRSDKGFDELMDLASETKTALQAPCQSLCHGPIAAVRSGSDVRWFSHIRSKSMRKALVEMMATGRVPKELSKHEVTKHRNELKGSGRLKRIAGKRIRSAA